MARATYTLELELTYNTWTDVTADWQIVTPLVIERGIEPGERVAGVGRMELALHNPDGRYTPGHANCTVGFEVGIGVRLKASDGADTYPLFYGRLAWIEPQPLRTRIVCLDDMTFVGQAHLAAFPLLLNATPRDLVNRLVDASFAPPGVFGYWRLAHPVAGRLGQGTILPGEFTGKDFDAGQSIFPWAGDTWRAGMTAHDALVEVCASESGAFHIAADGTPVFEERHARPRHTTPDAALSGSLARLDAAQERSAVANRVEVTVYPREAAADEAVLWFLTKSIQLAPGVPRTLICRYFDPDQQAVVIGAQDVRQLEPVTDYRATDRMDGTGQDATPYVSIQALLGATSAQLVLTSQWPAPEMIYVHMLQVCGKPVRVYQPVMIVAEDDASHLARGLLVLRLGMPLQDDAAVGEDMARALLANRKDPHPWLVVTVEATVSSTLLTHALARDVGDRLAITDASLALDEAGCFIEGIRHEIGRGGASHRTTWRTSPADLEAYWVLDRSGYAELGQSARLGY